MRGFKVKEGRITALDLMLTNADAHIRLTLIGSSAWELLWEHVRYSVLWQCVVNCGIVWFNEVGNVGYGWLWLCECMGTRQPGCIHSPPADRRLSCGLVLDLDCGNHNNKLTVVFNRFYIIVRIIQGSVFLHFEPLSTSTY